MLGFYGGITSKLSFTMKFVYFHEYVAKVGFFVSGGNGPEHYGVCSTWLDSLCAGDMVPVLIRS